MRFSKSLARMFSFLREFHSCVCGIKAVMIEKITIQKKELERINRQNSEVPDFSVLCTLVISPLLLHLACCKHNGPTHEFAAKVLRKLPKTVNEMPSVLCNLHFPVSIANLWSRKLIPC